MKRVLLLASVLLLLASCAGKPVYNVDNAAIVTGSGSAPSLMDVRRAIVEGAVSKGWITKDIDSNHLLATHTARKLRMASVLITYSTTSFTIAYNESNKLKYDGATIHGKYNRWVRNLEQRIRSRLAAL